MGFFSPSTGIAPKNSPWPLPFTAFQISNLQSSFLLAHYNLCSWDVFAWTKKLWAIKTKKLKAHYYDWDKHFWWSLSLLDALWHYATRCFVVAIKRYVERTGCRFSSPQHISPKSFVIIFTHLQICLAKYLVYNVTR